jgi:ABC-type uncharacterized transport system auxiliary subunit
MMMIQEVRQNEQLKTLQPKQAISYQIVTSLLLMMLNCSLHLQMRKIRKTSLETKQQLESHSLENKQWQIIA